MTIPTIITGDDVSLAVTLKKNGATFNMSGATVKAALVASDHSVAYTEAVAQSSGTSGANWAASLVVVVLSAAATALLDYQGNALLEIQVDDGTKTTWFVAVEIRRGNIA